MVVMRNGVAVALCFYAVSDIVKRNWVTYYFKIFLAIGFHSSAFIFLPFYFLSTRTIKPRLYLGLLLLIYVLGLLKVSLLGNLPFLSAIDRLSSYVNNPLLNQQVNLLGVMEVTFLLTAVVVLLQINKYKDITSKEMVIIKIFIYGLFIRYALCNISGGLSTRFSDMCLFSLCIVYAIMCRVMLNKTLASFIIILLMVGIFFIRVSYVAFPLN